MNQINDWPELDKQNLLPYLAGNALRSKRYKLLYVATPKVACTSLKWWFANLEDFADALRKTTDSIESDPDLIIHDMIYSVAPTVAGLPFEELFIPLTSEDYFRFAVVRNPFKRVFSAWQSKLLLREPQQIGPYVNCDFYKQSIKSAADIALAFEGFLEHLAKNESPNFLDLHWMPQLDLLRPDLINYSKLVKIENTEELSTALSERLGNEFIDPFATRSANESLIPYLPELITARSTELITLLYAKDFEAFDYSKQLPLAKEAFSDEQFKIAINAIHVIRGRHKRLGEIRTQTINLKHLLVERGIQTDTLNEVLAERDSQITNLNQTVADCDQEIAALLSSISWRLTKPLRLCLSLFMEKCRK
ncbi:MAG: sulfotransferase family 2 domain-containing protein [Pseudomonadota bacterium]